MAVSQLYMQAHGVELRSSTIQAPSQEQKEGDEHVDRNNYLSVRSALNQATKPERTSTI